MSTGADGEELAKSFLMRHDYEIIAQNYHSRFGEIDIVAKDGECIVFVEVKTRTNTAFGNPLDAINYHKLSKIIKTSEFFLNQYNLSASEYRIDAIEITFEFGEPKIEHVKNITM